MEGYNDGSPYGFHFLSGDQLEFSLAFPQAYQYVPQPPEPLPNFQIGWNETLPRTPQRTSFHEYWQDTPTVTHSGSVSTIWPSSDHEGSDLVDTRRSFVSEDDEEGRIHKRLKTDKSESQSSPNRATGACLSCQMRTNKHRCTPSSNPLGPCLQCIKKATTLSPAVVVCRKARFQDVEIIRLGPSRDFANTLRWLKKDSISQSDPQKALWKRVENLPRKKGSRYIRPYKTLFLSQGYTRHTLNLRVQEFDPAKDDKQHYTWFSHGSERIYECPPFAVADRDHAQEEIGLFISANVEQYITHLLPETSNVAGAFVRKVFLTALARSHEFSLVGMALRFWVAGRFIETPWSIVGEEKLGMTPDTDKSSPYYNRVPVTPIMDFQIDNIVIHEHLKKLLQGIRKSMRQKIMPIKKEDWFDIHLTTFILLHHVDLTMRHDMDFARQHNLFDQRFSNKPLIEMITFGANTLLEYFHHEKGHFPLSAQTWREVESSYKFSESQKAYLLDARRMIGKLNAPSRAGDPLYWTAQLYSDEWEPTSSAL